MKLSELTQKLLILVIDDEPAFSYCVKIYLQEMGPFEVKTANSPIEGLEMARREHPDVIVTDLMMPAMRGDQLREQIREDSELKETPVILLSSLISENEVSEEGVIETRGCIFMPKPPDFDKLTQWILNSQQKKVPIRIHQDQLAST